MTSPIFQSVSNTIGTRTSHSPSLVERRSLLLVRAYGYMRTGKRNQVVHFPRLDKRRLSHQHAADSGLPTSIRRFHLANHGEMLAHSRRSGLPTAWIGTMEIRSRGSAGAYRGRKTEDGGMRSGSGTRSAAVRGVHWGKWIPGWSRRQRTFRRGAQSTGHGLETGIQIHVVNRRFTGPEFLCWRTTARIDPFSRRTR